jgi:fucose 4-O-acetylase-like acetyltransferase
MPLFIIISGYFSRKKATDDFWESILRLVRIYLIFHVFWIGLDVFNGQPITMERIFSPSFTLWYLHCLVLWRIILQHLPQKYLDNTFGIMLVSSSISILGGFIPVSNFMALQRLFTFMPLFFLGYYIRKYGWMEKIDEINIFFCIIPIALILFENRIYLDIWGRSPYASCLDIVRRVIFLGSSVLISIAFVRILLPLKFSLFAKEGKDVLFYYMYHSIVLYVIAYMLRSVGILADGYILIMISLVTMLVLFLLRRVVFLHIPLK